MFNSVFHPFPRLPQELRLEIWEQALPSPRIIDLRYKCLNMDNFEWETQWVANCTPVSQSLKYVNKEAREVFYQAYKTMAVLYENDKWSSTAMTEVDYGRDTAYFSVHIPERSKIIVAGSSPSWDDTLDYTLDTTVKWCGKLKTVALDLAILQKPFYRRSKMYGGFNALLFDPKARVNGVIEDVLAVFPALERLYFVIDTTTDAPRAMVDPLDSEDYRRWHDRHGSLMKLDWMPSVVASLQENQGKGKPLEIGLKIFVAGRLVNSACRSIPNKIRG
jgi:hypothetical protein